MMKRFWVILLAGLIDAGALSGLALSQQRPPHNVILFIPDGLRPDAVNNETAPTFTRLRDQGVYFVNSHSIFPTLTMVNSAAMGTGHFPGDMGNFGNTIYTGFPVASANGTVTPMIENNAILGEINPGFGGNYLNEESLLAAARKAGFLTASVGKVGPAAIYDVTERSGEQTIIVDDLTGRPGGLPLSYKMLEALQAAGLPHLAPGRGDNAKVGSAKTQVPPWRISSSSATSWMLRLNRSCRCSKPQESPSCWFAGRAIPTAPNIIKATAWNNSSPASMVLPHRQR